jgi:hypothetical protein
MAMTTGQKIAVKVIASVVAGIALLGLTAFFAARRVAETFASTLTSSRINNQFGDQWLKSAVAQIELHKLRYGKYPKTLQDLRYLGPMDASILYNVAYNPNADLTAYYVEVSNGFLGKPNLEYPDEFWQGTGFRKDLKPPLGTPTEGSKPNPPLQPARNRPAAERQSLGRARTCNNNAAMRSGGFAWQGETSHER